MVSGGKCTWLVATADVNVRGTIVLRYRTPLLQTVDTPPSLGRITGTYSPVYNSIVLPNNNSRNILPNISC